MALRRKRRLFLALLSLLGAMTLCVHASVAEAQTYLGSPFGNAPTTVRIGRAYAGGIDAPIVIMIKNDSTGSCSVHNLGNLTSGFVYTAGDGNDKIYEGTPAGVSFCGATVWNIQKTGPVSGWMDIHGGGGNDIISMQDGDVWLFGDDGNDQLATGPGTSTLQRLFGGNGDDYLQGESGDELFGESGADLRCGTTIPFDGGSGIDCSDSLTNTTAVESGSCFCGPFL